MIKIYTKTGDQGQTSIFTGQRISKNDPLIEAIGTIDETNTAIGAAVSFFPESNTSLQTLKSQLEIIQQSLFDVGAALATPLTRASNTKLQKTRFDQEATGKLEQWIDAMEIELPPLKTFILPGGHPAGAMLHLARSICRRGERKVLPMNQIGDVSDAVLIYLNRLSDYLFVASRYLNHKVDQPGDAVVSAPIRLDNSFTFQLFR